MYVSVNDNGRIVAFGLGRAVDSMVSPEGFDESNRLEWLYADGQWSRDLSQLVADKQTEIKLWVAEQIEKSLWRIERATGWERLNISGSETLNDVYAEHQSFRAAGNRSEAEVAMLTSQADIEAYTWDVKSSDWPQV